MSSSTPPQYAHGVMEYLLCYDKPSPVTPQSCKYTPTARKQIPVILNTYYRNVIKFHICGHICDKIAVAADEVCYNLPDVCYWICPRACDEGFEKKSCAQDNAESLAITGEAAGTSFEGILYEQWSEYLTKLRETKKSLSGYELSERMVIESVGGNRDADADRERFAEGESKDEEATVVERVERVERLERLENIYQLVGITIRNPIDIEMG
ncbi:hypothetical protein BPAE_0002g00680 [Botrytis paeoniae]|uniref:Uncharacterized protein n=1 Tax=Botrytis paeoniae TaxID=278948 RepID=A0A4Z1GA61_9HELO|nr:hypothetical protein BPAE_0002g00680 [Botrytis paeoniae]